MAYQLRSVRTSSFYLTRAKFLPEICWRLYVRWRTDCQSDLLYFYLRTRVETNEIGIVMQRQH
jgi:hypothetical protein